MEKTQSQRYAESLEKAIHSNHHNLKKIVEDFREMCQKISPERNIPRDIVIDIRESYKEIRDRLKEIRAIQNVLQSKYRQYVRRDPLMEKELTEFGFLAKTCYSRFEYTMMQIQGKEKAKEKGRVKAPEKKEKREVIPEGEEILPLQWFRSGENQVMLLRNFRILDELAYEVSSPEMEEKREVHPRPRGFTFFVFTGESTLIDGVQSRMKLREHDILERYGNEELRGVLTHLRELSPLQVETVIRRFIESGEFSRLKCLLIPVQSKKDLESPVFGAMERTLQEMPEGIVKTVSV
jgi:hypothetical protein